MNFSRLMLPLIPIVISSISSLIAAVSGWAFVKIQEIDAKITKISTATKQLQASTEAAKTGSLWTELLDPIAKTWSKPITRPIGAMGCALLVLEVYFWG
jgi:hypothetical protein